MPDVRARDVIVAHTYQARCKLCPWTGELLGTYQEANSDRQGHMDAHRQPLTVAAVSEDLAEAVGELADAAQQAACRHCLWDIFPDRGWRLGFGGSDPWHCDGHPGGHEPAAPGELVTNAALEAPPPEAGRHG